MVQDNFRRNMRAPLIVVAVYLLLVLSRIIETNNWAGENEYVSVIVLQLLVFLLPSVIYTKIRGGKFALKLRVRPIGAQKILLSVLGALALICGSLLLNILFADGIGESDFSLYNTFTATPDGTAESFLYVTLAYAALPAICEEFFFRSLLCAEYEKEGLGCALIMSSLFFGMIHFNFGQLIIYFFAGIVLFLTMYATRSVIGCMCVHFLYNMYGLFGQGFINEVYRTTGSTELFLLILATLFLLFAALFCGEASRLYRLYSRKNKLSDYIETFDDAKKKKRLKKEKMSIGEALLAPPCLVCYLIFVIAAFFA